MEEKRGRGWVWAAVVVAGSYLFMLPTFVGQSWAMLDDPDVMTNACHYPHWQYVPDTVNGRFRPLFWGWYAVQFRGFGLHAVPYYVVQGTVLAVTNLGIYGIGAGIAGRRRAGLMAAGLFATATPIAECYYTICKSEPMQVMFLVMGIWSVMRGMGREGVAGKIWVVIGAGLLLAGQMMKETTVLMPAMAGAGVVGSFWMERGAGERWRRGVGWWVLGLSGFFAGVFVWVAYWVVKIAVPGAGQYTGTSMQRNTAMRALRWYAGYNLDVVVVAGLAILGVGMVLMRRGWREERAGPWMVMFGAGAGIFLGFQVVVWPQPFSYYLLPVAAWGGMAVALWVDGLWERREGGVWRAVGLGVMGVVILTRVYSVPKVYSSAVALKQWNWINGQMMEYVVGLPRGSRVLLACDDSSEYPHQLERWLALHGRGDVVLGSTRHLEDWLNKGQVGAILLLSHGGENNAGVVGRGLIAPLARRIEAELEGSMSGLEVEEVFSRECRAGVFVWPRPTRVVFRLAWRGYRISGRPYAISNRYADGWIGKSAEFWVRAEHGGRCLKVSGRALPIRSMRFPVHVRVWKQEECLGEMELEGAGVFRWLINMPEGLWTTEDRYVGLRMTVDEGFVPSREWGGEDDRVLSVLVDETRFVER